MRKRNENKKNINDDYYACIVVYFNKEDVPVLIYTSGDEETHTIFSKILDENGFENQYKIKGLGSSKADIEKLDVLSFNLFYVEPLNDKYRILKPYNLNVSSALKDYQSESFSTNLGFIGTIFYNVEKLKENNLSVPTSLKDLAKPEYKGHLSFPNLAESTKGWLMIQQVLDNYSKEEANEIIVGLKENARINLESSELTSLKKVVSNEITVGFGIKDQIQVKKNSSTLLDLIDIEENNYYLTKFYVLTSDNPKAQKMVETLTFDERSRDTLCFQYLYLKDKNQITILECFSKN